MTKHLVFPGIYLTNADTGKRETVQEFHPGDALVAMPQPILGYTYHDKNLTVYVSGTMPLDMRAAHEEGRTDQEAWLVDQLPAGIREVDWTNCRHEFSLKKAA
jgi:hypothetical protein